MNTPKAHSSSPKHTPDTVWRHVAIIPIKTAGKSEGPKAYLAQVMHNSAHPEGGVPRAIVALSRLEGVPSLDGVRDVLSKGGKINVYDHGGNLAQQGITELHEFHIPQDTLFREREIDPAISDASRILDGHIRDGRRVVLSSDLGGRRTAATLYFLFRRGGNTHEEALQHTQQVLKRANTWRDDMFKVYKKKWWHLKNIDEFALLREGGDKL